MQPHKRTAKSKAVGQARARHIIKTKLWWLHGFPFEGQWVYVPSEGTRPVQTLQLDGGGIHSAVYAMTKLVNDFPRALPAIVGDTGVWSSGVKHVLDALKPWVHSAEAPNTDLFLRDGLYENHPALLKHLLDEPDVDLGLPRTGDTQEQVSREAFAQVRAD